MFQPKDSVYTVKQQQFNTIEEAFKDFRVQRKVLYEICKDYPSVSIIMVLSEVNGSYCLKRNLRAGLVGHPKYELYAPDYVTKKINIKTKPHIHIIIVGKYSSTVGTKFAAQMCKRFYRKHPDTTVKRMPFLITKNPSGKFSLKYLMEQARNTRYVGDRTLLSKYNSDYEFDD